MRPCLTIAGQTLRLVYREKQTLIWMLLVPVIYIALFGSAFKESRPHRPRVMLSVRDEDRGLFSRRLLARIDTTQILFRIEAEASKEPSPRVLRIPASFTPRLRTGGRDTLVYEIRPDANPEASLAAKWAVQKAAYHLLFDLAELRVKNLPVTEGTFDHLDRRDPLIRLCVSPSGRLQRIPAGFAAQVPSQVVQFTLLVLFIYAGNILLEERQKGLLRRMRIAPISWMQLYFGKLIGAVSVGLGQMGVLFVIGRGLFGVGLGKTPIGLIGLSVTFAVAAASMGLTLGFVIRQGEKLTGIAIVLALVMAALSGCWWPIEITPVWMQRAALFFPSGLALKGYHRLLSFGDGFREILPYLAGEAGVAGVFGLLFAWVMNRRVRAEEGE